MTDRELRDVVLQLQPEGEYQPGSMSLGQLKSHMDPPWPIPKNINVSFVIKESSLLRRFSLRVPLEEMSEGVVRVEIIGTNGAYTAAMASSGFKKLP